MTSWPRNVCRLKRFASCSSATAVDIPQVHDHWNTLCHDRCRQAFGSFDMDMRRISTRKRGRVEGLVLRPSFDSSFIMFFPARVCSAMKETLLALEGEVDFYLGLSCLGIGGEMPAFDGIFCGGGEKGMSGFDFGGGDGAIGLDGDQEHHLAADVHAFGEFGIGRSDTGHDCSMDVAGEGCAGAEGEACEEKSGAGGAERDCQGKPPGIEAVSATVAKALAGGEEG